MGETTGSDLMLFRQRVTGVARELDRLASQWTGYPPPGVAGGDYVDVMTALDDAAELVGDALRLIEISERRAAAPVEIGGTR